MSNSSKSMLDKFIEAGFEYQTFETSNHEACVKILFPEVIPSDAAVLLNVGIEEAERHWGEPTTVWLEVADLNDVPDFVDQAVRKCGGFGVRIFASDLLGNVSHGSKNVLKNSFVEKLGAAGSGWRWNNIEKGYF